MYQLVVKLLDANYATLHYFFHKRFPVRPRTGSFSFRVSLWQGRGERMVGSVMNYCCLTNWPRFTGLILTRLILSPPMVSMTRSQLRVADFVLSCSSISDRHWLELQGRVGCECVYSWLSGSWFNLRAWPWDLPAGSSLGFLTTWQLQGNQLLPGGSRYHTLGSSETLPSRGWGLDPTPG